MAPPQGDPKGEITLIRNNNRLTRLLALGIAGAGLFAVPQFASAQASLFTESLVGAGNANFGIYWAGESGTTTDAAVTASWDAYFTGLNGSGASETMYLSGTTTSQSNYGQLHVYTQLSLNNSYYNASNPQYFNGSTVDATGSPNSVASLGFATFTDTLQFGGDLVTGYQAIYVFHVDGTNTGDGALADLAVNIPSDGDYEGFFDGQSGFSSEIWATEPFQVNGQNEQTINVQFSDQVVLNTFDLTDGGNYSGTSDFSQTLTLAGIELVGPTGQPLSGWTVDSESGTVYNQIEGTQGTPGPAAAVPFVTALGAALRRRRRSR